MYTDGQYLQSLTIISGKAQGQRVGDNCYVIDVVKSQHEYLNRKKSKFKTRW